MSLTNLKTHKGGIMLSRCIKIFLGFLCIMSMWGCAQYYGESQLDRNWGRSFESAKYNQILNPEAEKNLKPVVGLEGRVEEKIMEGYVKGFEGQNNQASPPSYGISSGTSTIPK